MDGVLGPPESAWDGAERASRWPLRLAAATPPASQRHLLLPVLHAVQARVGWISPGALDYVCRRLTSRPPRPTASRASTPCSRSTPRPPLVAHVCDRHRLHVPGRRASSCAELERDGRPGRASIPGTARRSGSRAPAWALCERAPAALVTRAGDAPASDSRSRRRAAEHVVAARSAERRRPDARRRPLVPQAGQPGLRLLRRVGRSIPRASTATARTAATRRCAARSSSARPASSAR